MPWNTPGSHAHIEKLLRVPEVDPFWVLCSSKLHLRSVFHAKYPVLFKNVSAVGGCVNRILPLCWAYF